MCFLKLASKASIIKSKTNNDENDGSDTGSNMSVDMDSKHFNSVEYIEVFAENIDFSLKLLKHENLLIDYVYQHSNETCIELKSKLTIQVIDFVQSEIEEVFFTNSFDFTKLNNNGNKVIQAITRLIVKVQNLKAYLQTEGLTMTSASKLIQFLLKLNEIGSQIFASYLDVVKAGYFENPADVPMMLENYGLHINVKKICVVWLLINNHEKYLTESVSKACNSYMDNTERGAKTIKTPFSKNKKNHTNLATSQTSANNDNDEVIEDDDEVLRRFQQSRRSRIKIKEEDDNKDNTVGENSENLEQSSKFYFYKYYMLLIQKTLYFLHEETAKLTASSQGVHFSLLSSSSFSNNFNGCIKKLQVYVFLVI